MHEPQAHPVSSTHDDVVVLCGGLAENAERFVSVASAQNFARALPGAAVWFWAPDGAVYLEHAADLEAHARPFEVPYTPRGDRLGHTLPAALDAAAAGRVFVLALHGRGCEDGTVQAWLEARDLAFTGSDAAASARAFDKSVAKGIVQTAGLRIADGEVLHGAMSPAAVALLTTHDKAILKPAQDGSSHGLHILAQSTADARIAACTAALATLDGPALLEAFVVGRELTCGVLDTADGPIALPVSEVRLSAGRTFDYEGKYLGDGVEEITPADVPQPVWDAAQHAALTAHAALGCTGYSRTDLMATPDGVVFIETNTLPGMSPASFIPQQLEADGRTLDVFCAALIARARAAQAR